MNWLWNLFRKREQTPEPCPLPQITPASVEAHIERAGREAVFARARELGWTADRPAPLWVWNMIAAEVRNSQPNDQTLH